MRAWSSVLVTHMLNAIRENSSRSVAVETVDEQAGRSEVIVDLVTVGPHPVGQYGQPVCLTGEEVGKLLRVGEQRHTDQCGRFERRSDRNRRIPGFDLAQEFCG